MPTASTLDVPSGFRTQLDARLHAAIGDRIALGGRVEIVRGAYRDPISLAAIVADAARRRDLADAPPEEDTLARRVDLDVAVTSTEDLSVDNNYGRMDLGLDVRLVGTAAARRWSGGRRSARAACSSWGDGISSSSAA